MFLRHHDSCCAVCVEAVVVRAVSCRGCSPSADSTAIYVSERLPKSVDVTQNLFYNSREPRWTSNVASVTAASAWQVHRVSYTQITHLVMDARSAEAGVHVIF